MSGARWSRCLLVALLPLPLTSFHIESESKFTVSRLAVFEQSNHTRGSATGISTPAQ